MGDRNRVDGCGRYRNKATTNLSEFGLAGGVGIIIAGRKLFRFAEGGPPAPLQGNGCKCFKTEDGRY